MSVDAQRFKLDMFVFLPQALFRLLPRYRLSLDPLLHCHLPLRHPPDHRLPDHRPPACSKGASPSGPGGTWARTRGRAAEHWRREGCGWSTQSVDECNIFIVKSDMFLSLNINSKL